MTEINDKLYLTASSDDLLTELNKKKVYTTILTSGKYKAGNVNFNKISANAAVTAIEDGVVIELDKDLMVQDGITLNKSIAFILQSNELNQTINVSDSSYLCSNHINVLLDKPCKKSNIIFNTDKPINVQGTTKGSIKINQNKQIVISYAGLTVNDTVLNNGDIIFLNEPVNDTKYTCYSRLFVNNIKNNGNIRKKNENVTNEVADSESGKYIKGAIILLSAINNAINIENNGNLSTINAIYGPPVTVNNVNLKSQWTHPFIDMKGIINRGTVDNPDNTARLVDIEYGMLLNNNVKIQLTKSVTENTTSYKIENMDEFNISSSYYKVNEKDIPFDKTYVKTCKLLDIFKITKKENNNSEFINYAILDEYDTYDGLDIEIQKLSNTAFTSVTKPFTEYASNNIELIAKVSVYSDLTNRSVLNAYIPFKLDNIIGSTLTFSVKDTDTSDEILLYSYVKQYKINTTLPRIELTWDSIESQKDVEITCYISGSERFDEEDSPIVNDCIDIIGDNNLISFDDISTNLSNKSFLPTVIRANDDNNEFFDRSCSYYYFSKEFWDKSDITGLATGNESKPTILVFNEDFDFGKYVYLCLKFKSLQQDYVLNILKSDNTVTNIPIQSYIENKSIKLRIGGSDNYIGTNDINSYEYHGSFFGDFSNKYNWIMNSPTGTKAPFQQEVPKDTDLISFTTFLHNLYPDFTEFPTTDRANAIKADGTITLYNITSDVLNIKELDTTISLVLYVNHDLKINYYDTINTNPNIKIICIGDKDTEITFNNDTIDIAAKTQLTTPTIVKLENIPKAYSLTTTASSVLLYYTPIAGASEYLVAYSYTDSNVDENSQDTKKVYFANNINVSTAQNKMLRSTDNTMIKTYSSPLFKQINNLRSKTTYYFKIKSLITGDSNFTDSEFSYFQWETK